MRDILATVKPVLHVPAGLCAAIAAMTVSVIAALSSPIPHPKPDGWHVAAKPTIVVTVTPVTQDRIAPVTDWGAPVDDGPSHTIADVAAAKAYLARTAYAGGSIRILGREKSIACLHPQFALNLAATIRDARKHGYPDAAVFSGCRPPRLGIGGFKDKRKSLHGVGLAADIHGIGAPCSARAKRFHKIASVHGVYGAYGPCNRAEFNHMQGTTIKQTSPALRATFTKAGDIAPDLERMWRVAGSVVLAAGQPVAKLAGRTGAGRTHAAKHRRAKRAKVAKRHNTHRRVHVVRRHRRFPQQRTWSLDTWTWERWT